MPEDGEGGREGVGEGYLELIWPCTPPPLPEACSRFFSWGAEPIESELDLIASLDGKATFQH